MLKHMLQRSRRGAGSWGRTMKGPSPRGLTTGGVLAQLLEEWSQRVQFRAKVSPITGFQLLNSAVVVAQGLPRSIGLGAGERRFGWRPRGRRGRGGFLEERCQRPRERLV